MSPEKFPNVISRLCWTTTDETKDVDVYTLRVSLRVYTRGSVV